MAGWCGNNNNQKRGIAEASQRSLYLAYLGSRASAALKKLFGKLTCHLCACTVQDDCFFFLCCMSSLQRSTHYISTA